MASEEREVGTLREGFITGSPANAAEKQKKGKEINVRHSQLSIGSYLGKVY